MTCSALMMPCRGEVCTCQFKTESQTNKVQGQTKSSITNIAVIVGFKSTSFYDHHHLDNHCVLLLPLDLTQLIHIVNKLRATIYGLVSRLLALLLVHYPLTKAATLVHAQAKNTSDRLPHHTVPIVFTLVKVGFLGEAVG